MSDILARVPPHDKVAEMQVLGCIIIDQKVLNSIGHRLREEDFYVGSHRALYRHLCDLDDAGKEVDAHILVDHLKSHGALEQVGGIAYIAELIQSVSVASYASHYAGIVIRHSQKRKILAAATEMLDSAYDESVSVEDALSKAELDLSEIKTGTYSSEPVSMYDATVAALGTIDQVLQRKKTCGTMTGLPVLDSFTGGVFAGELVVLAARTGQGKTSMALQMAAHMADHGKKVYFVSLEMGVDELAIKRICSVSGVGFQRIRSLRIRPEHRQRLSDAAAKVANKNLMIHDWPEIRPFDIQRAARRLKADVIFVDYLQYVTAPDKTKKRYEQVGDISRQLKTVARRLDIPVVALAQIGRQAEATKEAKPRLSHLRESGNIEMDCDMALLLWRPEEKPKNFEWDAELEVAKNRKGALGTIRLDWNPEATTFSCHGYIQGHGSEPWEDFEEWA